MGNILQGNNITIASWVRSSREQSNHYNMGKILHGYQSNHYIMGKILQGAI
jgi:hypothetical protein